MFRVGRVLSSEEWGDAVGCWAGEGLRSSALEFEWLSLELVPLVGFAAALGLRARG